MRGSDVKLAQSRLTHNRFGNFGPGKIDGEYGATTAAATRRAKNSLGYSRGNVNGAYGPVLHNYLSGTKLPRRMRLRRQARKLWAKRHSGRKDKALSWALSQANQHVTERPYGSNLTPYGREYGFNGVPWCAIFVSIGLKRAGKNLRTALAYQWEWWGRARSYGLSITGDPEPGDIVVYHHGQGHTGFFYKWVNRSQGIFLAVEGNTAAWGGSQDNGGAVLVQKRDTGWAPCVFVRWS